MKRHILLAGAGAMAVTIGAASAQGGMEDMDLDGDGRISAEEWDALGEDAEGKPHWSAYDADRSGGISEDEFRAGEFGRYDRNADAMLEDDEYQARSGGIATVVGGEAGEPGAEAAGTEAAGAEAAGTETVGTEAGEAGTEQSTMADAAAADATAMQGEAATGGLEDIDADGDAFLTPEEFSASLEGETGPTSFGTYDADASGDISGEEFAQGEFGRFDLNDDGMIDQQEYQRYLDEFLDSPTEG